MFKWPVCLGSMETDDPSDADYVVYGHVVCGRICYDYYGNHPLKEITKEPKNERQLTFTFESG